METLAEIDEVLGDADAREAAHTALFGEPSENLPDDYSFTIGTSIWANPDQAPLLNCLPFLGHEKWEAFMRMALCFA